MDLKNWALTRVKRLNRRSTTGSVYEDAIKSDDEIVKDIYAQGAPDHEFNKGTTQETSAKHLDGSARKPPSKAQSYGFPRGRVDSPLLYSFSRELEESAAFSEANQEGQLSKLWEVESWLMSQPFSFQLLRLEPDVTPFKGSYSDASEFPYRNVWEAFLSVQERRSDRLLRKEIMAAQAVLSCSLDYLGISRSLKMRWKPYLSAWNWTCSFPQKVHLQSHWKPCSRDSLSAERRRCELMLNELKVLLFQGFLIGEKLIDSIVLRTS